MITRFSYSLAILCCGLVAATVQARTWTDQTGNYTLEGTLFALNDEHVVIEREDGQLGMFRIDVLSDADQEFLKGEESKQTSQENLGGEQTWEMKSGLKLLGKLVDYARKDVTIQRRRGKIYFNDRQFENLPPVYQQIAINTLNQFEGLQPVDKAGLTNWVLKQQGQPRTFTVDGVVMELADGNEYTVPFVLFSDESLQLLKGGWEDWLEAHDDYEERDDESFRLQAQAAAMAQQQQQMANQIAVAQFNLDLIRSGITSLWEVTLYPVPGNPSAPRWVLTQGRNSLQASNAAMQQNPGFRAGPTRRIR